jgi:hypothetical protein
MLTSTVIAHFGGGLPNRNARLAATARALRVTKGAVRQWGEYLPPAMAMRAYCASDGALFLDPYVYEKWPVRGAGKQRRAKAA